MSGKPFQFSMLQLFFAVTLLCIGLAAFRCLSGSQISGGNFVAAIVAIGGIFGASIGFMFRPPAFFVVCFAAVGAFLFPLGWIIYAVIVFLFFNPIRC
jgi:hypothetical protein